jgi:ribose 5-phosphate isomerase RpiB
MKVVIASDHGGMNIRKEIISLIEEMNIDYLDLGVNVTPLLTIQIMRFR